MLELLYTSTKAITLTGIPASMAMGLVYIASWDALLLLNGTRLDKIFRDGSQAILGAAPSHLYLGSRVNGRHFWLYSFPPPPGTLYGADEITGQYRLSEILDTTWPIPSALTSAGNFIDDGLGLYIINTSGGHVYFYQLSDGSLLGSVQLNSSLAYNSLAYVGRNQVMAFQKATGQVALIDYLHQQVLWQSTVRPALVYAYDSRHNLIITIEADLHVRVYLTTALPAILSNPEFYPAAPQVTSQQGYPVRVRLTDAGGAPCPGYWISWDFVNIPALGAWQRPMSQTDAAGYAWNYWFGPPADLGQETMRAEVTI